MTFPYDRSNNPLGPIQYGKSYNFFQKLSVTTTTFNTNADMAITFTTQGLIFINLGTGVVEWSANGSDIHGELNSANSSVSSIFNDRVLSKIWFRVQSGSSGPIIVSVQAWATQGG